MMVVVTLFEHSLFDKSGPRVRVCCWWFCVSWFLVGSCFLVFGGFGGFVFSGFWWYLKTLLSMSQGLGSGLLLVVS